MYAVVLAGGGGTRLWPLSRARRPKPFLPLVGGRSLLGETVARLSPLLGARDIFVVTDRRYTGFVAELLPDLPAANIVAEPVGRNTAAAVALAAIAIERAMDEVMLVLPADHAISDAAGFRSALEAAGRRAERGDMVTLGITPDGPATGYGYVLARGEAEESGGWRSYRVERFEEKPTPERAGQLISLGRSSWNAGIFVWRRDALLAGLERHAPDILSPISAALGDASDEDALAAAYSGVRATSIDYALLEPASLEDRVAVVPVDVGWSDLGSWAALHEALATESHLDRGVVLQSEGDARIIETGARDALVHAAGGRLVAVVGLRDVVVVDTPDALLVCSTEAAQDVRKVVDRLVSEEQRDLL